MKILEYPDDFLRIKSTPVDKVTPELVALAHEMYRTMKEANGLGLSAPQVGLPHAMIVIENGGMLAMFNPMILKRGKELITVAEGCLSFPNVFRIIQRPSEVIVKYRDIQGKMKHEVYKGIVARAIIHEIDHLNAKLFIDLENKA